MLSLTGPVNTTGKPGVDYDTVRQRLKTFDAILFRGSDMVSKTIIGIEGKIDGTEAQFSHSALVIEGKHLMPIVRESERAWLRPEGLYIFESTMSGSLTDGVNDVEGRSHLCVQLRDMDQVIRAYDLSSPDTRIAWCPIKECLRAANCKEGPEFDSKVRAAYDRYLGLTYDASVLDLGGAASPVIRWFRDCSFVKWIRDLFCDMLGMNKRGIDGDSLPHDNRPSHWQFCSELCANVYRDLGLVPLTCNPEDVMPQDMVPKEDGKTTYDSDGKFPVIFDKVVRIHAHQ